MIHFIFEDKINADEINVTVKSFLINTAPVMKSFDNLKINDQLTKRTLTDVIDPHNEIK